MNMKSKWVFALGLAVAFPLPALAQVPAIPQISSTATPGTQALSLASLYLQEDRAVEMAMANFDKSFLSGFNSNQQSLDLEAHFPGVRDAALTAGRDVFRTHYVGAIPAWKNNLAQFIEANFAASEIADMIRFYTSPAGSKSVSAITDGADTSALAKKFAADPHGAKIDATDVNKMMNVGNLSKLSQAELAEVMKFNITPTGQKFTKLSPQLLGILLNDVNKTISAVQPVIQAAVIEAVSGHIAHSQKPARAKRAAPAGSTTL